MVVMLHLTLCLNVFHLPVSQWHYMAVAFYCNRQCLLKPVTTVGSSAKFDVDGRAESGSILASRSAAPGSILGDFLKLDVAEMYEQRTLLRVDSETS